MELWAFLLSLGTATSTHRLEHITREGENVSSKGKIQDQINVSPLCIPQGSLKIWICEHVNRPQTAPE